MKTVAASYPQPLTLVRTRLADYLELTKPRISLMVLVTVAAGAIVGARGMPEGWLLWHVLLGTGLVAAGASSFNQLIEREIDGRMERTGNRPVPAGRLLPAESFIFASILTIVGIMYLFLSISSPAAAVTATVTFLCYVCVYTPLKQKTSFNTLIGAIPGALPPVIGYAAVCGTVDVQIAGLFAILFFWQVPHFLAIAWIYREDYRRAGLCMLPVVDPIGGLTGRQMVVYCAALVPVSLLPLFLGQGGMIYACGAVLLGSAFLASTLGFLLKRSMEQARGVLLASLIYLPVLLVLLVVDATH
jgi:protoheme IX farnesyltransferase